VVGDVVAVVLATVARAGGAVVVERTAARGVAGVAAQPVTTAVTTRRASHVRGSSHRVTATYGVRTPDASAGTACSRRDARQSAETRFAHTREKPALSNRRV
jgi:hypothetical protein